MYFARHCQSLRLCKPLISDTLSPNIVPRLQPFSSSGKSKKSGIYTKTGDTGFSSVRMSYDYFLYDVIGLYFSCIMVKDGQKQTILLMS